jgi:fructokinase
VRAAVLNRRPLILALGEILWDLLPSGKQLGGAPANFAYHAAQLGADAKIVSAVGDDALGYEILGRLRTLNLDTTYVAVDPQHPTGTVTVALNDKGEPSYKINEDVAWDFIPTTPALLDLAARADCVCFGTLAQRSSGSRHTIREIFTRLSPGALRVFDVNLRQRFYDRETVRRSLEVCNVVKLNDEELASLGSILDAENKTPFQPIRVLQRAYQPQVIALTRGAGGSTLFTDGQPAAYNHPGVRAEPLVDTVGAGDAFTAALAVGMLRSDPLHLINDNANRLASYVCTQSGATPPIPPDLLRRLASPTSA